MKPSRWQIIFGISLIGLSAFVYILQIQIFKTPRDTFFYLFQDLAFVPISVLMVTVIIDQVLRIREKRALLKKMNMVIGAFNSEVGTTSDQMLSSFDVNYEKTRKYLVITMDWSDNEFSGVGKKLQSYEYAIDSGNGDLEG